MRDVTNKIDALRTAVARAELRANPATLDMIREGRVPKGDPLPVAKVAAVQAAKNTPQLIPYCHPVPITFVGVEFEMGPDWITATCTVRAIYKTGVEMEALTAASAAVLNLYDMLKMLDEDMEILSVKLLSKSGGKSDFKLGDASRVKAAVVVISDSVHDGRSEDLSGSIIDERLQDLGLQSLGITVCPDEPTRIVEAIRSLVSTGANVVVTTGGTGIGPRDLTPEAVRPLFTRELEGVAEALRVYGQTRTPYAMLSRSVAGLIGETIVVCLPGAPGAVEDGLTVLFPYVLHALKVLTGARHDEPVPGGAGP